MPVIILLFCEALVYWLKIENEEVEEAFINVIKRPSVCVVLAFRRSVIPPIPRKAEVVAFTRIRDAFPKLATTATGVEVAKSFPDLKAIAPVTFKANIVEDAPLIFSVAFGVVVPIPIVPLFLIQSPWVAVVEEINEARVPRVEVPIFRTASNPLLEFSTVEEEVTSNIVPPVRELAFKLKPV